MINLWYIQPGYKLSPGKWPSRKVVLWPSRKEKDPGGATRPEWIYSQGVYFESRARGKVKIFGLYNNKQKNQKKQKRSGGVLKYQEGKKKTFRAQGGRQSKDFRVL